MGEPEPFPPTVPFPDEPYVPPKPPPPPPEPFPEPIPFPDEPYVPPKPPPPKPPPKPFPEPTPWPDEPYVPPKPPKPPTPDERDYLEPAPFPEVTPWPDEVYAPPIVPPTAPPLVTGPPPAPIDYTTATTAEIDQYTRDYLAGLSDEELQAVSGGYKVGFDWGTTVIKSPEAREAAIELAAKMFLEKEAAGIEKTKIWRQARYELGRRGIEPFTGTEAAYYGIPRGKPTYMSGEAWAAAQKKRKAYMEKKAYAETRMPRESVAEWRERTGGLIPAVPLGVTPLLKGEVPDAQKAFSDYITASEAFYDKWGPYFKETPEGLQAVLETDKQVKQYESEQAALEGLHGGLPYTEEGKIDVFPALAAGVSPETLEKFGVTGPLEDMAKVAPFIGAGGILTLASVKALTDKYGVTKTQSLLSSVGVEGAASLAPLAPYVKLDDTINVEGLIDKYGTRRATAILTAAGVEDARGKVSAVAQYEIGLEEQKVAAKEYEEFIKKTVPTEEYSGYGIGQEYLKLMRKKGFVPTPELYYSMHPEMTAGDVVKSYRKLYGGKEPTEVPTVGFVGSPPVSYQAFTAQFLEVAKETAPDFSRAQFPHRAEELWEVEMKKVAGEKYRELYGTGTFVATAGTEALAGFVAPARALHPEVKIGDIKAWEWGLGAAQVATLAAPVWVPKIARFATPVTRVRPQFPITRAGLRSPFYMKPLPPPTAPVYPIVTEPFGFPGVKAPMFRGMPPVADGYGLEAVSRFAPRFHEIYPKSWAFEYPPLTRVPTPTVGGRLVPTEVIPGKGWGIPLEPEWTPYIYGGRLFPPGRPLPTVGTGTATIPTTRTMTEEAVARQLAALGYEYPPVWAVTPSVKAWPFPIVTPITQPVVSPVVSPFIEPVTVPLVSPITEVAIRSLSKFGAPTAVAPAVVVEPALITEPFAAPTPFVPIVVPTPPPVIIPPPVVPPPEWVPPPILPFWPGFPSLKEGAPKAVRPKGKKAPLGMWIFRGHPVFGPHPLRRELVGGRVGAFRRRYGAVEPRKGILSTRTSGSTGSYNRGRQYVPTMVGG